MGDFSKSEDGSYVYVKYPEDIFGFDAEISEYKLSLSAVNNSSSRKII